MYDGFSRRMGLYAEGGDARQRELATRFAEARKAP